MINVSRCPECYCPLVASSQRVAFCPSCGWSWELSRWKLAALCIVSGVPADKACQWEGYPRNDGTVTVRESPNDPTGLGDHEDEIGRLRFDDASRVVNCRNLVVGIVRELAERAGLRSGFISPTKSPTEAESAGV